MPNGLAIYDLEGKLMICNKQYQEFLDKYCHVEDGNLFKAGLPEGFNEAIERDGFFSFLMYFDKNNMPSTHYAGGPVNRVHAAPVIVDGKTTGISLAVSDATEEVKHEHMLNAYRRNAEFVLKHMNSGLVYLTPEYQVRWKGIDSIYGKELAQKMYVVGSYCYQHFGLTEPCKDCPVTWAMKDKENKHRVFHDPSNDTHLDVNVTLMREGNDIKGYLMELRDITEQMKAINQLKEAQEKAKKGESAKAAFLKSMSHELRTPLNAMLGFSSILASQESATLSEEERKEYSEMVHTNAISLANMVSDMLDITQLETEVFQADLHLTELEEFLNICLLQVTERVKEEVTLTYDIPKELVGLTFQTNQKRLVQAILHMLTNACKHTEKGSIVLSVVYKNPSEVGAAEIESSPNANGWLEFAVTDTGCGVPESQREEIFKPFVKLDQFKTGTGLGLTICSLTARLFGGSFKLDTTYTDGARFVLTHALTQTTGPTMTVADVKA